MLHNNEQSFKRKRPNANKELVQGVMKMRKGAIIREFINRQLYIVEARERDLAVNSEIRARIESSLRAQAKKEGKTIDALAGSMGDTGSEMRCRINEIALIETLMDDEFGDELVLNEEDIKNKKQSIVKYNKMCDATNKLVVARGKRVVKELRAGIDFKEAAAKYSEADGEEGGYWDEFTRYEIDDANVRHAAFTLPVGAVSDPFDTEEGLVIIKVLERSGIDAVGAEEEAFVKLGRILLRLGENRSCPPDQELRKDMARLKREHFQIPFIKNIRERSRIEFPHGTNLWPVSKGLMPVGNR